MIIYTDTKPTFGYIYQPKAVFGFVFKPAKNYYNMWVR